ncbi:GIY-YIG catalytic domain-containing protein [Gillisia sp. Hel1_33_143]|uniref:GIY-YIG nuclease family protein n=1 Tax=Gillisia sp. Hel1_33_143 TaxID=1336796 RepID=UPI00087CEC03|nr:GIY-YIG nuclease family protein [Gillisia sp. Hel1_33_143]SDS75981.1 GIY-YIG catalytic domain-containing protein [Gillisia sp. Hel1_33_143]
MNYTKKEIVDFVDDFETELFNSKHIKFNFDKKWSSNFPSKAGIYAIYDKDKLVYVGETANLKERMKEVKRTYNHSFRRKLGKFLVEDSKIVKGKFGEELELRLNDYYVDRINFRYKEINFGRLEVESYLIHRHCDNGLLNSPGKRNRIE